jgi:hypothetical protein
MSGGNANFTNGDGTVHPALIQGKPAAAKGFWFDRRQVLPNPVKPVGFSL